MHAQGRLGPLAAVLACAALLAACGGSGSGANGSQASSQNGAAAASNVGNAWPLYGHDLSNTRLNPNETEIDSRSVASLTRSWEKGGIVSVTGTPTVSHGMAYFGDGTGSVWAVKAKSGQVVWQVKIGGSIIGSPAVVGNAVYVGVGKTLYRLDSTTGAVQWKAVTNANPFSQINASPVVVGDMVIQGTAQFEEVVGKPPETFRGSIGAFDTKTGKQLWNFFTTPNNATSGAGEGVWSTPAVDTKLGLLYVGVGQDISEPTGPLADSLIAIRYKTGKEVWNRSLTPGSTFGGVLGSAALVDGKIITSSNVGDPTSNATTNKSKVFALDPATGRILWTDNEKGNIFGPVSAVPGLAFVGTDAGTYYALDTSNGATLWSFAPPAQVGGGASIVNGNLLWGYGFTLFKGSGKGGIIDFKVSAAGRVHQERGG